MTAITGNSDSKHDIHHDFYRKDRPQSEMKALNIIENNGHRRFYDTWYVWRYMIVILL